jgi:hypothetical protein
MGHTDRIYAQLIQTKVGTIDCSIIQLSKRNVPSSCPMSRVATERKSVTEQQDNGNRHTLTSTLDEGHPFQLAVLDFVSKADVRLVIFDREWL